MDVCCLSLSPEDDRARFLLEVDFGAMVIKEGTDGGPDDQASLGSGDHTPPTVAAGQHETNERLQRI